MALDIQIDEMEERARISWVWHRELQQNEGSICLVGPLRCARVFKIQELDQSDIKIYDLPRWIIDFIQKDRKLWCLKRFIFSPVTSIESTPKPIYEMGVISSLCDCFVRDEGRFWEVQVCAGKDLVKCINQGEDITFKLIIDKNRQSLAVCIENKYTSNVPLNIGGCVKQLIDCSWDQKNRTVIFHLTKRRTQVSSNTISEMWMNERGSDLVNRDSSVFQNIQQHFYTSELKYAEALGLPKIISSFDRIRMMWMKVIQHRKDMIVLKVNEYGDDEGEVIMIGRWNGIRRENRYGTPFVDISVSIAMEDDLKSNEKFNESAIKLGCRMRSKDQLNYLVLSSEGHSISDRLREFFEMLKTP